MVCRGNARGHRLKRGGGGARGIVGEQNGSGCKWAVVQEGYNVAQGHTCQPVRLQIAQGGAKCANKAV